MVEHTDDGLITKGSINSRYDSMILDFYLSDWTEVEYIPLKDIA